MSAPLRNEEERAVKALEALAKRWPESLWLFASGSGNLHVMRKDENGKRCMLPGGGVSSAQIVATINIECDGGDW